jgi:formate dehydrogenase beta subunit
VTIAILVMLGIGATCGIILSVASKVFYVYEDPRIAEVEYFMAGANCGGCGLCRLFGSSQRRGGRQGPAQRLHCRRMRVGRQHRRRHGRGPRNGRTAQIIQPLPGWTPRRRQVPVQRRHDLRGHDNPSTAANGSARSAAWAWGTAFDPANSTPSTWDQTAFRWWTNSSAWAAGPVKRPAPRISSPCAPCPAAAGFNEEDGALAPCQQTCPAEIDIPQYIA